MDSEISNLTILRPRNSLTSVTSSTLTIEHIYGFYEKQEERRRREFIMAILLYGTGLFNLWRFPQRAFMYGEAVFVYLHLLFTIILSGPLLFFELILGQYSSRGINEVFCLIPLFEGIKISIIFYIILVCPIYNILSLYAFVYVFKFMDISKEDFNEEFGNDTLCDSGMVNRSQEAIYFYNEVVMTKDYGCTFNQRNACILFIIWTILFLCCARGHSKVSFLPLCLYIYVICSLLYVLVLCLLENGSIEGIKRLFVPNPDYLFHGTTFLYSLEQAIITVAVGSGCIINFGSFTKFKSPIHLDCILVLGCTVLLTFLYGMVFFAAVGVIEYAEKKPVIITDENDYFAIMTKAIYRMENDLHVSLVMVIFYTTIFFSGITTSTFYSETFLLVILKILKLRPRYTVFIIAFYCFLSYIFGLLTVTKIGPQMVYEANRLFIGPAAMFIVACEILGMLCVYGSTQFTKDTIFMTGLNPGPICDIIWTVSPIILFLILGITVDINRTTIISNLYFAAFIILIISIFLLKAYLVMYYACVDEDLERAFHRRHTVESGLTAY